jgi:hypothetical protein
MRWLTNVMGMREVVNAYKILSQNLKEKYHMGDIVC